MNKMRLLLTSIVAILLLIACSGNDAPSVSQATAPGDSVPTTAPPTQTATTEPTEDGTETQNQPADLASSVEPIEVTYFTPAQQEGPYYTVDKPADRDNDLTILAGASGTPEGTPLEFGGTVYDAAGMPLEGLVIEIWQTDSNGVYLHPNDPSTANRDPNFQFYGEATTSADGSYYFRTILPGKYEPRPVHIHVKIKAAGQELLTTQFYFEDDSALATEGLTTGDNVNLIMSLTDGIDASGHAVLIGERDVVLRKELPDHYPKPQN